MTTTSIPKLTIIAILFMATHASVYRVLTGKTGSNIESNSPKQLNNFQMPMISLQQNTSPTKNQFTTHLISLNDNISPSKNQFGSNVKQSSIQQINTNPVYINQIQTLNRSTSQSNKSSSFKNNSSQSKSSSHTNSSNTSRHSSSNSSKKRAIQYANISPQVSHNTSPQVSNNSSSLKNVSGVQIFEMNKQYKNQQIQLKSHNSSSQQNTSPNNIVYRSPSNKTTKDIESSRTNSQLNESLRTPQKFVQYQYTNSHENTSQASQSMTSEQLRMVDKLKINIGQKMVHEALVQNFKQQQHMRGSKSNQTDIDEDYTSNNTSVVNQSQITGLIQQNIHKNFHNTGSIENSLNSSQHGMFKSNQIMPIVEYRQNQRDQHNLSQRSSHTNSHRHHTSSCTSSHTHSHSHSHSHSYQNTKNHVRYEVNSQLTHSQSIRTNTSSRSFYENKTQTQPLVLTRKNNNQSNNTQSLSQNTSSLSQSNTNSHSTSQNSNLTATNTITPQQTKTLGLSQSTSILKVAGMMVSVAAMML